MKAERSKRYRVVFLDDKGRKTYSRLYRRWETADALADLRAGKRASNVQTIWPGGS